MEYQQCLEWINNAGCSELVIFAKKQQLQGEALVVLAEAAFYQQWIREVTSRDPSYREFNRVEHESIREEYALLDSHLPAISRRLVTLQTCTRGSSAPKGTEKGLVSDLSEMSLLYHESSKERRFLPVRELVNRAGNSLRSLMPCWLMSPQSVAQFIAPGNSEFDLLIMDEASQIRPEEALGAIARARQIVVVGDSQQMPPTRLFETVDDDDNLEPKAAFEVVESILQRAKNCFPVERLRWHYRSQHEDLIIFSNSRYYDNQLVIPPSIHKKHTALGIKLHYCANASYKKGLNEHEARAIVDNLIEHIILQASLPTEQQESVAVVAMNEKQRDLIEEYFDNDRKSNTKLARAYDAYNPRGRLVIKNLESIQGDERDVIYISLTYGPEPGAGLVRQQFTGLTRQGGGRRLNVLLTRARKRMHVFSSLRADQIYPSQQSDESGLADLKAFLRFAETGSLPDFGRISNRAPDSDFEVSVLRHIQDFGFEAYSQVGVNGFRIDIGVSDPEYPGVFLAGIECDGAPYHSHPIARERDRWRRRNIEETRVDYLPNLVIRLVS